MYYLNITINDTYDNSISRLVWVNITVVPDTTPPWFDPIPSDQHAEYGQPFIYDVDAYDDYQLDMYWLNDTNFSIDGNGIIENATHLIIGLYSLNISVNDTSSNSNWTIILVNVTDTTPPSFTAIYNITHPYNTTLGEQFSATDFSGVKNWAVNDTDFKINNTGYLENNSFLTLRYHWINITVNDTFDNENSQLIYVNVVDVVLPWFDPIPVDQYVEFGDAFSYDINATDDIAVDNFTVNNTDFIIDNTGLLRNNTGLAVGLYYLNITVNDTSGNENSTVILVNVSDTTDPVFSSIWNITIEFYSDVNADFDATDLSGIKDWTVDHDWFEISGSGVLTNKLALPIGEYWLTVTVNDTYDNTDSQLIYVNITEYTGNLGWFVQQGETRMTGARTYVDIQEVRTDHAFIHVTRTAAAAYDEPDQSGIWAEFINETRFVLHQGVGMANSNYVGWQVVENPNIKVQHYNTSFTTAQTILNIPLTNRINTSKTVVFIDLASSGSDDSASYDEVAWTGEATSSTNVRIKRDSSGSISGNISLQVVEFNDGSTIQEGDINDVGGLGAPSYIDLQTPANITKSWLYFSHASTATANGIDDFGVHAKVINSTRWEFVREATGGTKRVHWYVITTPGANVQNGTIPQSDIQSGYYPTEGLNPVQTNKTALLFSYYNTGGGTTFANYHTSGYLYNSTHWYLRREATGNAHALSWQMIEFPEYGVTWNQTELKLGSQNQSEGNLSGLVTIDSVGSNDNIIIQCSSGNCSLIQHNFTDGANLGDGESAVINFTCLDSSAGNLSAIFQLSSVQDPIVDTINVSCEMIPNPSYHIYYGNASGEIKLGLLADVMTDIGQGTVKNIYVADIDSVFEFKDLQALGRKKDNTSANNDFAEADNLLNMSHKFDSISFLWAPDGTTPSNTDSLVVYGRTINNVPIINSTNSSIFITGILWDMNDSLNDEFNVGEAEDLVFVTKYNSSQVGKYGTYGYELRIPGTLDEYKGSNHFVTFYVEAS